jgi:phage tail-like protein
LSAYNPDGAGLMSLKNFRRDVTIELYNLQGTKVRAWNVFRCWVSEFTAVPELDANANGVAFETIVLQNEGFMRDEAVVEQAET